MRMTTTNSIRVVAFAFTGYPVTDLAASRAAEVTFVDEPLNFPRCNRAVVKDPDGHRLVIHQKKSAA
jgi:hypothetical protein